MNISTYALEKRTVGKTMKRILPFILILYIIAHLDRVNLGYAALDMNADLALSAEVFGLLSGIFFIGYFFFEVPSNMIMHKIGARIWIARIMITWGIIVVLTGFVQSATHLYILRFLLGVAEAGFFPGIILYLTYWFRSRDRGRATAILLLALPLGGLFGAPLSTWIMDNIFWYDLAGWRWMFILEGIPAVVLGIAVLFYLTNKPSDAKWLTLEEKQWLENELNTERKLSAQINKTSKLAMLKDSKVWKLALLYFTNYTAVYGLSFWMPTMIKRVSETGTTNLEIGWVAMIPSLIAIPSILFVGWNADRTNKYKAHLISCFIICIIGFIGCSFANSVPSLILLLSVVSAGLYGFAGCFFAYMTFFFTESTSSVGIALVNSLAALGGFVGPMMLGLVTFTQGMLTLAGLGIIGLIILLTLKLQQQTRIKEDNIKIAVKN